MTNLCEYDRIRLDIIAERKEEWDKLVSFKTEFAQGNKKKKPKSVSKLSITDSIVLRRSSRKKPKVYYKEAGQAITMGFLLHLNYSNVCIVRGLIHPPPLCNEEN